MLNTFLIFAAIAGSIAFYLRTTSKMLQRTQALEKELRRISVAVGELAEFQMQTHQKANVRFIDMEQRFMELSIPSHESSLPLERRHQVLALARQGVALPEIVKRLKAPVGEAELILNLSKYMGAENAPAGKMKEQVRQYA